MEVFAAFSSAAFVITLFWAVNATRHSIRLTEENVRLQRKLQEMIAGHKIAVDMMNLLSTVKPKPTTFDQQTTSLIKLAVGNSNENEARSAALQACKRLHKQIK